MEFIGVCRIVDIAIDGKDKSDLLEKLHKEWLEYQKRQSDIIQAYLKMRRM